MKTNVTITEKPDIAISGGYRQYPTVNSLSGGKTSSFMAMHVPADLNIFACVCIDYLPAAPKDKALLKYAMQKLDGNFIASAEHEKTLKVMMDLEQLLGNEIVWVRGKSFDEVVDGSGCLPTWARRFCTTDMKLLPIFEYVYPRYGFVNMNIGFRIDEPERIKKAQARNDGKAVMEYPISCNNFGKRRQNWSEFEYAIKRFPLSKTFHYEIRNYWKNEHSEIIFPFDSNCRGCHHKPKELIRANFDETPEILEWFSLQEKKPKNGKNYTWQDDKTTYDEIFKTEFPNLFSGVSDFTMCNTGGCTD